MDNQKTVEKKLQYIKKALQKNRRIEVLVESPKEAYIQGVLARGDRRLGAVLAACAADQMCIRDRHLLTASTFTLVKSYLVKTSTYSW